MNMTKAVWGVGGFGGQLVSVFFFLLADSSILVIIQFRSF
jgi:hypothetical protein